MDSQSHGQSDASTGSAFFSGRLAVTDGGPQIDLYECDGRASIERGEDNEVGSGFDLEEAWNDYLYTCGASMTAPVDAAELAAMWADYDAQNV